MTESASIHIAFAADENYVQHLGVSMMSVLHNINPDVCLNFTVIGDNLSAESISKLKEIGTKNDVSIAFPEVDFEIFNNLKISAYFTRPIYAKLVLPDIIKEDKVLYLDCDILVRKDISFLWEMDISEYYSCVVIDPPITAQSGQDDHRRKLGMPQESSYFNAGVLLLNLKKCRKDNVMDKAMAFMLQNPDTAYNEQDALNSVMAGTCLFVHPRWNVQTPMFDFCYDNKKRSKLPKEIIEAVKDPAIVHFTSTAKPWHYGYYWPYADEYYKYLSLTPWEGYQPIGWTLQDMARMIRRKFKRRLMGAVLGYRV